MNRIMTICLFLIVSMSSVTPLFAEITTIDGTVKSVDVKKRTITLETGTKEMTLDVGSKAKINVDGKESSLDSLKTGLKLKLSYHDDLEVVVKIESSSRIPAAHEDAVYFENHAYKVFPEILTWHRAKKRCEEMGGHLAIISSAEEDEFIARLAEIKIKSRDKMDGFWLGATDEEKEGDWK